MVVEVVLVVAGKVGDEVYHLKHTIYMVGAQ